MKLIIDIPDEVIKTRKYDLFFGVGSTKLTEIIENGIPYEPKGDLISREALKEKLTPIKLYGGVYCKAITEKDIDNAPTVVTYSEEDMCDTTSNGYDIGYAFAKRCYEFDTEGFKKFVESRIDMQDLYLSMHFFDLLDEYCGSIKKGGAENDYTKT